MISASELKGVLGMMPAFATADAVDIHATQTIAVGNLKEGVDKIIKDGVNNIATTGTYGECYNLLFDEFKTLAVASVEAVKKRVPLFIGCTSPNPREVVQKMNFVRDLGADGVLLGVPYYETLHLQDAIKFYHDIADLFPSLNILIYHNPDNHKFTIPVSAFKELVKKPSIIGMKDSHNHTGIHEFAEDRERKDQCFCEPNPTLPVLPTGRRRLLVNRGLDGPLASAASTGPCPPRRRRESD
jgi:trans-o-hydroxybenzylidenepyruvate hydratase-aldolase